MNYYDVILGLIPTALIGGITFGDAGVLAGGTVSLALLAHALFVNPPLDPALGPHQ